MRMLFELPQCTFSCVHAGNVARYWLFVGFDLSGKTVFQTLQQIWTPGGYTGCLRSIACFRLSTDPEFVAKVRDIVGLWPWWNRLFAVQGRNS